MGRLNKVMLIGNVGNTPEMRYTPSGQQLASINLAVGNKYTNREGVEVDDTQWFNVTVWAQRAEPHRSPPAAARSRNRYAAASTPQPSK